MHIFKNFGVSFMYSDIFPGGTREASVPTEPPVRALARLVDLDSWARGGNEFSEDHLHICPPDKSQLTFPIIVDYFV